MADEQQVAETYSQHLAHATDYDDYLRFSEWLGTPGHAKSPQAWVKEMLPTTLFLKSRDEKVAFGFAEAIGLVAYIRMIVVAPHIRRKGAGTHLLKALAYRMRELGCKEWRLNVLRSNVPAIKLYESVGLHILHESSLISMPWTAVHKLSIVGGKNEHPPSGSSSLPTASGQSPQLGAPHVTPVEARDDSRIESCYGLPAGQIQRLRGLSGTLLAQLVSTRSTTHPGADEYETEKVLGFCCFHKLTFNAFSPVHAERPLYAKQMIEHVQSQVQGENTNFSLFLENDTQLLKSCIDSGASVNQEFYHLRGKLPPAF